MKKENLDGEHKITKEHVRNNSDVRKLLTNRGIRPEELPPEEDIKKLEKGIKKDEKKIANTSRKK